MNDDTTLARAATWHLRVEGGDMTGNDWQDLTAWLEADPSNAQAYSRIVEADADLVEIESRSTPAAPLAAAANDDPGLSRRGLLFGGIAAAAAVIAAVLVWPSRPEAVFLPYTTAARETRTVAVADGLRVEMNGSTEIEVQPGNQPLVRILRGEAAFYAGTGRPGAIRVEAGELVIVDKGTIFNVIREHGLIRVSVAEGEVVANPDREAVPVVAGHSLFAREGGGTMQVAPVDARDVTGWQSGHLAFAGAPAEIVAADLERNLGSAVAIDPSLKDRKLTGVIQLGGEPAAVVAEAASLLGGRARQDGGGWVIAGN